MVYLVVSIYGYINPSTDPCSGVVGQYKMNSMVFCGHFASFCFVLASFIKLVFCLFYHFCGALDILFLYFIYPPPKKREKEHKVGWMRV